MRAACSRKRRMCCWNALSSSWSGACVVFVVESRRFRPPPPMSPLNVVVAVVVSARRRCCSSPTASLLLPPHRRRGTNGVAAAAAARPQMKEEQRAPPPAPTGSRTSVVFYLDLWVCVNTSTVRVCVCEHFMLDRVVDRRSRSKVAVAAVGDGRCWRESRGGRQAGQMMMTAPAVISTIDPPHAYARPNDSITGTPFPRNRSCGLDRSEQRGRPKGTCVVLYLTFEDMGLAGCLYDGPRQRLA